MQCNQVVKGKAIQKWNYFRTRLGLDVMLQDAACTGFSGGGAGIKAEEKFFTVSPTSKAKINLK